MYPHERSLVKRLEGKPFALIGVNSDSDKEDLKKAMEREGITWRSFWNGPLGTNGPISKTWNVTGWPTIYVLDEKGIIRYKSVRGEAMDKAVNKLLTKMGVKIDKEVSDDDPLKKRKQP
jgi:Thioredoxin-like